MYAIMKNSDSIHESKGPVDKHDIQRERDHAKAALKREFALGQILGNSKAIKDLKENLIKISSCNANVLITGESGTGKDLVARAIHYLSDRKGKPFIPVNCGAIPENLFENELFWTLKGSIYGCKCSAIWSCKRG